MRDRSSDFYGRLFYNENERGWKGESVKLSGTAESIRYAIIKGLVATGL